MKIRDWEKYIFEKYKAIKIEQFLDLKKYLTNKKNYAFNFTPEEITETEIQNNEYYGTYIFDENNIANRKTKPRYNSCWNKLIIIISTKDNINISNYCINTAGGLTDEESSKFYHDIYPLNDEKPYIKTNISSNDKVNWSMHDSNGLKREKLDAF